jgi:hypothetical protein
MRTIFRDDIQRIAKETEKATDAALCMVDLSTISQPGVDLSLGVDLRLRRVHTNPMAAAIDQSSSNSLKYQIRSPIKVPPNYEKKLRDLEAIGRQFEKEERKTIIELEELKKAKLKLQFSPFVTEKGETMEAVSGREEASPIAEEESQILSQGELSFYELVTESSTSDRSRGTSASWMRESVVEEDSLRAEPPNEVVIQPTSANAGSIKKRKQVSLRLEIPTPVARDSVGESSLRTPFSALPDADSLKSPGIQKPILVHKGLSKLVSEDSSFQPPKSPSADSQDPKSPLTSKAGKMSFYRSFSADKSRKSFFGRTSEAREALVEPLPENWQVKNVPFMLDIWAKSEGIDLDELLHGKKDQEGSLMNMLEKIEQSNPSLYLQLKGSDDGINMGSLIKNMDSERVAKTMGPSASNSQKQSSIVPSRAVSEHAKIISEGTYDLIKRLSGDGHEESDNTRASIERTLTGYDPRSGQWEIVETVLINSDSNRKRKAQSPFKNLTPGTCCATIGQFVSDQGDVLPFERAVVPRDCDQPFEIGLPDRKNEVKHEKHINEGPQIEQNGIYSSELPHKIAQDVQELLGDVNSFHIGCDPSRCRQKI